MKTLLLIEDDLEIGELLSEFLAQHQFAVLHSTSVAKGLQTLAEADNLAAIILDVMLPDGDGFEVCRHIRAANASYSNIPIIMLTAKGDAMDRIIGLEIGADDYLPKPFEPRELVARLKAVLRRHTDVSHTAFAAVPPENLPAKALTFGQLSLNPHTRTVSLAGNACDLTGHQYDILYALASRAGQVTSREQLINTLKDQDYDVFDRSIDVHISRIRAAIETDSKHPKRIITMRGVGYVFSAEQD